MPYSIELPVQSNLTSKPCFKVHIDEDMGKRQMDLYTTKEREIERERTSGIDEGSCIPTQIVATE